MENYKYIVLVKSVVTYFFIKSLENKNFVTKHPSYILTSPNFTQEA